MPGPIELSTARLDLGRWTTAPGDVAAFFAIWGDPRVIWWTPVADRDAARAVIERVTARCADPALGPSLAAALGWYAMIERATGAIVGNACLQPAPVPVGEHELGWHVARAHQGHGFATEAARALMDRAFALGLPRVIAEVIPLNAPSIAVARRLGMTPVGMVLRGCGHVVFARDRA